jgi:hypothetical protein
MSTTTKSLCALALGALLNGCVITPLPISSAPDDPSNPAAAEAAAPPLRPGLYTGSGATRRP